ncbi:hypothetical protein ACWGA9_06220 [Streptomyces sp. NPDC054950]
MANQHVQRSSDADDRLPRFRWDVPYLAVGGAALRYSSTSVPPFRSGGYLPGR